MLQALIHDPFTRLLAQIVAIVATSRVLGMVMRLLGQPLVIAEITAGILLGPSLLGAVAPEFSATLFEPSSMKALQLLSQVGLVLFMFLIGLEFDHRLIEGHGRASVVISHASIIAPFVLGAGLAWGIHDAYAPAGVSFGPFALFMGVAMSITAFPVLARILSDRRLLRSRIGSVTIACAAVDDVTAWCLLAFVAAAARSDGLAGAGLTTALSGVYIAVMFGVVRPILGRLAQRHTGDSALSQNVVAAILLGLFVSSWATELIGIHALFGAFVFGAILPKEGALAATLAEKLEDLVLVVLLPLFFAFSGVRTEIGLVASATDWMVCGAIIAVACIGKFGGSALAARWSGLSWRESATLGVLMNTRGLMELIILNVGLDLGVISPTVFAMMVIMALVTTVATSPLVAWLYPTSLFERSLREASTQAPASRAPGDVLACVGRDRSGPAVLAVAGALRGKLEEGLLHALHLVRSGDQAYFAPHHDPSERTENPVVALLDRPGFRNLDAQPLAFVSTDFGDDICRVAAVKRCRYVVMGWHKPILTQTLLGGTVASVMAHAPTTICVLLDRGLPLDASPTASGVPRLRRILVPWVGEVHDISAWEVASRLAETCGAALTVLHVTRDRAASGSGSLPLPLPAVADLRTVTLPGPDDHDVVTPGSSPRPLSPSAAVLAESLGFDLVVIGAGREWGLEQRYFGVQAEELMRDTAVSLLIVAGPAATPESSTRTMFGLGSRDASASPTKDT
ncbi:MAG: cation:proton antiporter [Myxococcales bacterium]|nr:cation:proton antiporter [Myxococcales bacterium]